MAMMMILEVVMVGSKCTGSVRWSWHMTTAVFGNSINCRSYSWRFVAVDDGGARGNCGDDCGGGSGSGVSSACGWGGETAVVLWE